MLKLVWLGIAGMSVGPFLEWMKIRAFDIELGSRDVTVKGTQSLDKTWLIGSVPDGFITLALAACVVLGVLSMNSSKPQHGKARILALAGLAGMAWAAGSWLGFRHHLAQARRLLSSGQLLNLSPSIGFWLAGVGSILVFVGGVAVQRRATPATSAANS